MTQPAQFIICEKSGNWAAAFRWHRGSHALLLHETRSLIDARAALASSPSSVIALETHSLNAEGVVHLTMESHRTWPNSRILILLARDVRSLDDLFWELGAALVVHSPRRVDRVVRFVERCLVQPKSPDLPTREWVWSRLPWSPAKS